MYILFKEVLLVLSFLGTQISKSNLYVLPISSFAELATT